MTSTALGAETKKEEKIIFISDAHEKFYYEKLKEVRYQDVYHKALCYCLGISDDTRRNVYRIYDFKTGCVITECLHEGWQTSGSVRVAGMKRILVKIVLPVSLLAVWMITCYPICRKAEGFDFFLYWVLVGCPYGIRKMCMILIPKNFGIAGSIGILALNCIVGGLIGGVVVILRMVMVLMEIIKIISDTSGHDVQRCR